MIPASPPSLCESGEKKKTQVEEGQHPSAVAPRSGSNIVQPRRSQFRRHGGKRVDPSTSLEGPNFRVVGFGD